MLYKFAGSKSADFVSGTSLVPKRFMHRVVYLATDAMPFKYARAVGLGLVPICRVCRICRVCLSAERAGEDIKRGSFDQVPDFSRAKQTRHIRQTRHGWSRSLADHEEISHAFPIDLFF